MGKYGVDAQDHTTHASSIFPAIALIAAAGERAELVELIMAGSGQTAPADTQHTAMLAKMDNAVGGTFTGPVTAEKFNEASAVASLTVNNLYTVVPTAVNTVYPVSFGFNQRGGMRWAVPKGEGIDINGDETELALCWQVISSQAGKVDANVQWWEP